MQPVHPTVSEVWQFPIGAIVPLVLVSAMLLVLGIVFISQKKLRILGALFLVASVIAGGVFAPSKVMERVSVQPKEFSAINSYWFAQKQQGFAYDKIRVVRFRMVGPNRAVQVDFKDGHNEVIRCTALWVTNYTNIMRALETNGVSFRNDVIGD